MLQSLEKQIVDFKETAKQEQPENNGEKINTLALMIEPHIERLTKQCDELEFFFFFNKELFLNPEYKCEPDERICEAL
jgi:hypothetical protein